MWPELPRYTSAEKKLPEAVIEECQRALNLVRAGRT